MVLNRRPSPFVEYDIKMPLHTYRGVLSGCVAAGCGGEEDGGSVRRDYYLCLWSAAAHQFRLQ